MDAEDENNMDNERGNERDAEEANRIFTEVMNSVALRHVITTEQVIRLKEVIPAVPPEENRVVVVVHGHLNVHLDDQNRVTWVGFPTKRLLDVNDKIIGVNGVLIDRNLRQVLLAGNLPAEGFDLSIRKEGFRRLDGYLPEEFPAKAWNEEFNCKHFGNLEKVEKVPWWFRLPDQFTGQWTFDVHKGPLKLSLALELADLFFFVPQNGINIDETATLQHNLRTYKEQHSTNMMVFPMEREDNIPVVAELFSGTNFYGVPSTGVVLIGVESSLWVGQRYVLFYPPAGIFFPDCKKGISGIGRGMRIKARMIIQGTALDKDGTLLVSSFFTKVHEKLTGSVNHAHNQKSIVSITWLYNK